MPQHLILPPPLDDTFATEDSSDDEYDPEAEESEVEEEEDEEEEVKGEEIVTGDEEVQKSDGKCNQRISQFAFCPRDYLQQLSSLRLNKRGEVICGPT